MSFRVLQIDNRNIIKRNIIAFGSENKPAVSWSENNRIYLIHPENYDHHHIDSFYEESIDFLRKRINLNPDFIALECQANFRSLVLPNIAANNIFPRTRRVWVLHHQAHIASCLFENNCKKNCIGIAFDESGQGSDGNIWGGEFYILKYKEFKRVAYFKYVPMPGGLESVRHEPWRMTFSYLYSIYKDLVFELPIDFLKQVPRIKLDFVKEMIDKKLNSPLTSSVFRLMDAVAGLLGICLETSTSHKIASDLEKLAGLYFDTREGYYFSSDNKNNMFEIDSSFMFRQIIQDVIDGVDKQKIAMKFFNTLTQIIKNLSYELRHIYNVREIYFSGDVFLNELMKERLKDLTFDNFNIYFNSPRLTTDLGIPLGQIFISSHSLS